jgi:hypothetical protein
MVLGVNREPHLAEVGGNSRGEIPGSFLNKGINCDERNLSTPFAEK